MEATQKQHRSKRSKRAKQFYILPGSSNASGALNLNTAITRERMQPMRTQFFGLTPSTAALPEQEQHQQQQMTRESNSGKPHFLTNPFFVLFMFLFSVLVIDVLEQREIYAQLQKQHLQEQQKNELSMQTNNFNRNFPEKVTKPATTNPASSLSSIQKFASVLWGEFIDGSWSQNTLLAVSAEPHSVFTLSNDGNGHSKGAESSFSLTNNDVDSSICSSTGTADQIGDFSQKLLEDEPNNNSNKYDATKNSKDGKATSHKSQKRIHYYQTRRVLYQKHLQKSQKMQSKDKSNQINSTNELPFDINSHMRSHNKLPSMTLQHRNQNQNLVKRMFAHAYDAYMYNAYPHSDLCPIKCAGSTFSLVEIRALTLIDSLDMLLILGNVTEFARSIERLRILNETTTSTTSRNKKKIKKLVRSDGMFGVDVNVSVFETTIRVLGGLLGAHQLYLHLLESGGASVHNNQVFSHDGMEKEILIGCNRRSSNNSSNISYGETLPWEYDGFLLRLAMDLGDRLLPAYDTATGIPYGTVNLLSGVPKGETEVASLAGGGTLSLEMETLSRLTGNDQYGKAAKLATRALWLRRSGANLLGKHIDISRGVWTEQLSGIGSNSDSFYEYLLKHYVLFGDVESYTLFRNVYSGIWWNNRWGDLYGDLEMARGTSSFPNTGRILESLAAFYPGLQAMLGELLPASSSLNSLFLIREQLGFLPERFNFGDWDSVPGSGLYPLRPELLESCYFLHRATMDIGNEGEEVDGGWVWAADFALQSLESLTKTDCGYANIKNVGNGIPLELEDNMPSYFLSETLKYLYLIFDVGDENILHQKEGGKEWVFTTEAHPLHYIPTSSSMLGNENINEATGETDLGVLNLDMSGKSKSHTNAEISAGSGGSESTVKLSQPSQLLKRISDDVESKGEMLSSKPSSLLLEKFRRSLPQKSPFAIPLLEEDEKTLPAQSKWSKLTDEKSFKIQLKSVSEKQRELDFTRGEQEVPLLVNDEDLSLLKLENETDDFTEEFYVPIDKISFDKRGNGPNLFRGCPNYHHSKLGWLHALNMDGGPEYEEIYVPNLFRDYDNTGKILQLGDTWRKRLDNRDSLDESCSIQNLSRARSGDEAKSTATTSVLGNGMVDMKTYRYKMEDVGTFDITAFEEGFFIQHVESGEKMEVHVQKEDDHSETTLLVTSSVLDKNGVYQTRVVISDMMNNSFHCEVSLRKAMDGSKSETKPSSDDSSLASDDGTILKRYPCSAATFGPTQLSELVLTKGVIFEGLLQLPRFGEESGCKREILSKQERLDKEVEDEENIQIVLRGDCPFQEKADNQKLRHDSKAVIVVNSEPEQLFVMSTDKVKNKPKIQSPITIMMSRDDGRDLIKQCTDDTYLNYANIRVMPRDGGDKSSLLKPYLSSSSGMFEILSQEKLWGIQAREKPKGSTFMDQGGILDMWQLLITRHKDLS